MTESARTESSADVVGKLRQLVGGFRSTAIVHAAAELALADHLAHGPLTLQELAGRTEAQVEPLRRLLRGLAVLDLVRERGDGRFELTDMGRYLRSDLPDEQRSWALLLGDEIFGRSWRIWLTR